MDDRDFLIWLHERVVNLHVDNDCEDFKHKLRNIIANIPTGQKAPAVVTNSMADLKKLLSEKAVLKSGSIL